MFRTVHNLKHLSFNVDDNDDDNFVRNAARGIHDDDFVDFFTANIPHDDDKRSKRDMTNFFSSFKYNTKKFDECNEYDCHDDKREKIVKNGEILSGESLFRRSNRVPYVSVTDKRVSTRISSSKYLKKSNSDDTNIPIMTEHFLSNSYPPATENKKQAWTVETEYKVTKRK